MTISIILNDGLCCLFGSIESDWSGATTLQWLPLALPMSQGLGVVVVFCGVWRRLRLRFVAGGAFDPLKEGGLQASETASGEFASEKLGALGGCRWQFTDVHIRCVCACVVKYVI